MEGLKAIGTNETARRTDDFRTDDIDVQHGSFYRWRSGAEW